MNGLTVCVGYTDLLSLTLPAWAETLDRIVVVTEPGDTATQALAEAYPNVMVHRTDVFRARGAAFNKGGAMSEAVEDRGLRDVGGWQCVFDADILPPAGWREELPELRSGYLYGAHRWEARTLEDLSADRVRCLNDREFPGYFWLFSWNDPALPERDEDVWTSWVHAGGFDSDFQARWAGPPDRRVRLPLRLFHLGTANQNWWGRGGAAAARMREMYAERARRGGSFEHERLQA